MHHHLAAERRLHHGDRHLAEQVGAVALEERMRLGRDEDVEIARRAAARAGLAFARQADARAVFDAGGDVDGQRALARDAAGAAADRARIVDRLAAPAACRAGALDGEETLLRPHAPVAAARRTLARPRAGLGARAGAGFARDRRWQLQARRLAVEGFLERDLHVVAEVRPACRAAAAPGGAAAPAAAHHVAEQIVENIGHRGGKAVAAAAAEPAAAVLEGRMAETIVGRTLLAVRQHLIGFVDFLEADLGFGIAGIAVGMVLHGGLAEGALHLAFGAGARDAEHLVVTAFGHEDFVPEGRAPAVLRRRVLPARRPYTRLMLKRGGGLALAAALHSGGLLLLVGADLLEVGIDDVVLRRGLVRGFRLVRAGARLVHGLTEFHRGLHEFVRPGLDELDLLAFERGPQRGDRRLDRALVGRGDLLAVVDERLFGRVHHRLAAVLGIDEFAPLLVFARMRFRVLDHLVDVGIGQTARRLDADLLLLVGRLVLRGHVDDAVGVDVERHLDLRHAARRAGNADEVELAEQLVVGRHFALALEDADGDGGLVVLGGREHLALLGGDRRVAVDEPREHAAQRLDAERERRHVEKQHVLDVALQHAGLHRRADRHHLVGVDALVRLLAEERFDDFLHLRHARHAADEHDFVDLAGR